MVKMDTSMFRKRCLSPGRQKGLVAGHFERPGETKKPAKKVARWLTMREMEISSVVSSLHVVLVLPDAETG